MKRLYRMRRDRGRRAFTLLELLAVIFVIAIVTAIMLPTMNRTHCGSNRVKCGSNMRQIGQAMNMYAVENNGWGVPGFIRKNPAGGRGEETWFTILTVRKYVKGVPSILDSIPPQGGDATPGDTAWNAVDSPGDSVFRCPSGADHVYSFTADPGITSKLDGRNSWGWRRQSLLNEKLSDSQKHAPMVDCWYAGNFILPTNAQQNKQNGEDAFPMRVLTHNRNPNKIYGGPLCKLSKIRKSAEIAMIFDGFECHNYNTNNISLRHSRGKVCNFLFADGHAQSVSARSRNDPSDPTLTYGLPNGHTTANSDLRSAATLVDCPFPKWRLDQ